MAGTYATLAATAGLWTGSGCTGGSYVPAAPDTADLKSGVSLSLGNGETWALGSKLSGVGAAIHLESGTTFFILSGGSVTFRGLDGGSNSAGLLDNGASFIENSGGIILLDITGDYTSVFIANGYLELHGLISVPTGNYNWANSSSGETIGSAASTAYFADTSNNSVWYIGVAHHWISNAAGTGIGSFGNSSLVFSSVSPGTFFTTEVATYQQVTAPGTFWVNYDAGNVIFYNPNGSSSPGVTANIAYKYLTTGNGSGFYAASSSAGNQVICSSATFTYLGMVGNSGLNTGGVIEVANKYSATYPSHPNQRFNMWNCDFKYGYSGIQVSGPLFGTAADPIIIHGGNISTSLGGYGGYYGVYASDTGYVTIENQNILSEGAFVGVFTFGGNIHTYDHTTLQNVTSIPGSIGYFYYSEGTAETSNICANCLVKNNTLWGTNLSGGNYLFSCLRGSATAVALITNNTIGPTYRAGIFSAHSHVTNNLFLMNRHHGYIASCQQNDSSTDQTVDYNVFQNGSFPCDTGALTNGYNYYTWVDGLIFRHNTMVASCAPGSGNLNMGDGDNGAVTLDSNEDIRDNLSVNPAVGGGFSRWADNIPNQTYTRGGFQRIGWNTYYNASPTYNNLNPGADFKQTGVLYNTSGSRLVTGVNLWDPSYTSNQTGGTLTYTKTSSINQTLAWSGGTAVQIIQSSGTVASASQVSTYGTSIVLNNTFNTTLANAANPTVNYVLFTSGAAAGVSEGITGTSSNNTIIVSPPLVSLPSAGNTYIIYASEVQLFDSGGTQYVKAQINPSLLPSSTQSDSNISITLTDTTTVNPQFISSNYQSWTFSDFQPLNSALRFSASDGTTPGAIQIPSLLSVLSGSFKLSGSAVIR